LIGLGAFFEGTKPSKDPRGEETASLPLLRRHWIRMLCRQTSPKRCLQTWIWGHIVTSQTAYIR